MLFVCNLYAAIRDVKSPDNALGMDNHSNRGWREPGSSIKDPGIARTGIGFLVMILYENT